MSCACSGTRDQWNDGAEGFRRTGAADHTSVIEARTACRAEEGEIAGGVVGANDPHAGAVAQPRARRWRCCADTLVNQRYGPRIAAVLGGFGEHMCKLCYPRQRQKSFG